MSEVLQANVFFFIASIATCVFCIMFSMILFQFYKIAKAIRSILDRIEQASEVVAEDVAHVRQLVASGGLLSRVLNFILGSKKTSPRARCKTRSSN